MPKVLAERLTLRAIIILYLIKLKEILNPLRVVRDELTQINCYRRTP